MLAPEECYRLLGPVDISGALPALAGLPFFRSGGSRPGMYACDVLVQSQFPVELRTLLEGLGLGGETARGGKVKAHAAAVHEEDQRRSAPR